MKFVLGILFFMVIVVLVKMYKIRIKSVYNKLKSKFDKYFNSVRFNSIFKIICYPIVVPYYVANTIYFMTLLKGKELKLFYKNIKIPLICIVFIEIYLDFIGLIYNKNILDGKLNEKNHILNIGKYFTLIKTPKE